MPTINLSDESTHLSGMPHPSPPLVDVAALRAILLDCRDGEELTAVKEAYGAEAIQVAWGTLTREERRQIHEVATAQKDEKVTVSPDFCLGDRVVSLTKLDNRNTGGTVVDFWEVEGRAFLTVRQDDGVLSAACLSLWAKEAQLGDKVFYRGKEAPMRQVCDGRELTITAIADGMATLTSPGWRISRQAPVSQLVPAAKIL